MTRGRKSTPKSIASLRGDPGKRRKKSAADPAFETAIPAAPDYLQGQALIEWDRITQELAHKQIITLVDQQMLGVYCQAVGLLDEVTKALETEGMTVTSTRGIAQINPLMREQGRLRQEIAKYSSELGITPTARNKVKMVGQGKDVPTKEQALAERLFRAKVKA